MCSGIGNEDLQDSRRPQRWRSAGPWGNYESAVGRKILGQGDLNDRLCGTRAPSPGTSPSRSSKSHNPFVGSGRLLGAADIPLPAPRPNARRGSDGTPLARETTDTGPRENLFRCRRGRSAGPNTPPGVATGRKKPTPIGPTPAAMPKQRECESGGLLGCRWISRDVGPAGSTIVRGFGKALV